MAWLQPIVVLLLIQPLCEKFPENLIENKYFRSKQYRLPPNDDHFVTISVS